VNTKPALKDAVTAVVLAGGMGRRMGGADKGLVRLHNKEMIVWVVEKLKPVVNHVIVNANRNLDSYQSLQDLEGIELVADSLDGFQGPLAGFEAGMSATKTDWIYVCPCDSPAQSPDLLPHMFDTVMQENAEIGMAFDGKRTHPVFCLIKSELLSSLHEYLQSGERKIDLWFKQHHCIQVDCSDYAQSFININTEEELEQALLERTFDGN